jgi:hypothetical protein
MNITELPQKAGPVTLNFVEGLETARREQEGGKFINGLSIPFRPDATFHPLKGGEQFLVRYPETETTGAKTLFAGMDESAFITGVTRWAWAAFCSGGEKGFFESLKPPLVREISQAFPQATVRRQGDIWSIAMPRPSHQYLMDKVDLGYRRKFRRFLRGDGSHGTFTVLNTNHVLEGRFLQGVRLNRFRNTALGVGVLTAPDHAPQELLEMVHLFGRTPNIQPATQEERAGGFE